MSRVQSFEGSLYLYFVIHISNGTIPAIQTGNIYQRVHGYSLNFNYLQILADETQKSISGEAATLQTSSKLPSG